MRIKRVLDDRALVVLDDEVREIGGIIIPASAAEVNQWGVVAEVGPECKYIEPGDHVLTRASSGTRFKKGRDSMIIIREGDILGKED